jgi:unsaturated chondroitin disaccharide hydrolase
MSADPATGQWQTSADGRWTGGFWAGLLWLAAHASGDRRYVEIAHNALQRLESRVAIANVLNGLVFHYGAAVGAVVHGDTRAATLAHAGAEALASHFNSTAGFIALGHQSGSLTGDPRGETNIDGLPGMSVLYWAAANGGSSSLADIATRHMRRHIELCLRENGSLHQAAQVDPATGAILRQDSPRGYQHRGTWARAQSWGMVGFAQAAAWTGETAFLDTSSRVATWWMAHVPGDRVAFWDFEDPAIPDTERDTSATAMAASALLKNAASAPPAFAKRCREHAISAVEALLSRHLTPVDATDKRAPGMLVDGCWQHNEGMATRHELIWGDYFLLEALLVLTGRLAAPL